MSPDELRERLRLVVQQGYALEDEECQAGQRCIGVPVYDAGGRFIAGLSVSNSVVRFSDPEVRRLVSKPQAAARIAEGFRRK